MSKGLEALKEVKKYYPFKVNELEYLNIDVIEKELKALEIINEIGFREIEYILCVGYETYCESRDNPISKEDYDLLDEVLGYD